MSDLDKAFDEWVKKYASLWSGRNKPSFCYEEYDSWERGARAAFELLKPLVESLEAILDDTGLTLDQAHIGNRAVASRALSDLHKKLQSGSADEDERKTT